jgi:signal transduction histidine kinase
MMLPALFLVLPLGALPGCVLTTWLHAHVAQQPVMTIDVAIRCLSATLSVIALCPLVLGLLQGFEDSPRPAAGTREQCAIGAAFSGLCMVYFAVPWSLDRYLELMLVAGPLLWLSLRCSQRAVAVACAAVAIGICVACAHGTSGFPPLVSAGTWRDGILSVQVFLLITCTQALLINRFVMDQRALLEDSNHKQAMLAAYGNALESAEDSARRAAARDLHDGVAQIIAGQSMILGALRRRIRGSRSRAGQLLDQAIAACREAQSAVRTSIEDLSPPEVDRASPHEMLTWLTEYFSTRYGFAVHWRISGDQFLDHGHSRLMYRATRELIYNAFRHSQSDSVRVALASDANGTVISVRDSGVGFDPSSPVQDGRQRHGLSQLAERLTLVRGRLQILASAGHGCAVTIFLPPRQTASRPVQPTTQGPSPESIPHGGPDAGSPLGAAE